MEVFLVLRHSVLYLDLNDWEAMKYEVRKGRKEDAGTLSSKVILALIKSISLCMLLC